MKHVQGFWRSQNNDGVVTKISWYVFSCQELAGYSTTRREKDIGSQAPVSSRIDAQYPSTKQDGTRQAKLSKNRQVVQPYRKAQSKKAIETTSSNKQ
jgi:hypothetical protein